MFSTEHLPRYYVRYSEGPDTVITKVTIYIRFFGTPTIPWRDVTCSQQSLASGSKFVNKAAENLTWKQDILSFGLIGNFGHQRLVPGGSRTTRVRLERDCRLNISTFHHQLLRLHISKTFLSVRGKVSIVKNNFSTQLVSEVRAKEGETSCQVDKGMLTTKEGPMRPQLRRLGEYKVMDSISFAPK